MRILAQHWAADQQKLTRTSQGAVPQFLSPPCSALTPFVSHSDINECDTGSHCCQQDCYNYPGGYECSCHAGYRLSTDGCGCDGECKHLAGLQAEPGTRRVPLLLICLLSLSSVCSAWGSSVLTPAPSPAQLERDSGIFEHVEFRLG